jgi:hypothetical protein
MPCSSREKHGCGQARGRRFDAWELAAARAAAAARALAEGGLAEGEVTILLGAARAETRHHRLVVRHGA